VNLTDLYPLSKLTRIGAYQLARQLVRFHNYLWRWEHAMERDGWPE